MSQRASQQASGAREVTALKRDVTEPEQDVRAGICVRAVEPVQPKIANVHNNELARRRGEQHLSTMTRSRDARPVVHVKANVTLLRHRRLARVQTFRTRMGPASSAACAFRAAATASAARANATKNASPWCLSEAHAPVESDNLSKRTPVT